MQKTSLKNVDAGKVYDWLSEILTPANLKDDELLDLSKLEGVDDPKLYRDGIKIKTKTVPFLTHSDYYESFEYLIKTTKERIDEIKRKKIGGFNFAKYEKLGNFIFSVDGDVLKKLLPGKVPDKIGGVFVKTHLINYREGIYTFGFVEIVIHSRLNLLREKFEYKGEFYPVCYNYTQLYNVMISKNDIRSLNVLDSRKNQMYKARMYYENEKYKNGRLIHDRNRKIESSNYFKDYYGSKTVDPDNYIQGYDIYAVAFMEMVSGDQKDLFGKEFPITKADDVDQCKTFVIEQRKILLQLLYALYCGHEWFEFAHRDCHSSNVMYKYFDKKETKTVNIIIPEQDENNEDLFFKFDTKHFVKIIDFGYSKTNLPDEQMQNEEFDRQLINGSLKKFGEENKEYGFKGFLQPFAKNALLFSDFAKFFITSIGDRDNTNGRPLYKSWKMLYSPKLHEYAKDLKGFVEDLFREPYKQYKELIIDLHAKIDKVIDSKKSSVKKVKDIIKLCQETEVNRYSRFVVDIILKANNLLNVKEFKRINTILKRIKKEIILQKRELKMTIEQHFFRMATSSSTKNKLSHRVLKSLKVEPSRYIELMKTHKFFKDIRMEKDKKIIEKTDDFTFVYKEKPKYDEPDRFKKDQVEKNPGLEDMFMQIKNNEI